MADSPEQQRANRTDHQFKPGQSGNPGGRPKGTVSLTAQLRRHLAENPDDVEAIIAAWVAKAKDGQFQHLQEMLNRLDGKVRDGLDLNANMTSSWPALMERLAARARGEGSA